MTQATPSIPTPADDDADMAELRALLAQVQPERRAPLNRRLLATFAALEAARELNPECYA